MNESLLFSEAAVRKCSIKKLLIKFLSKFTCNLIKKETPTHVYFCEFSKILKRTYLEEYLQMVGSEFCTVLYVSLQSKRERKLLLFECIEQDFNIGELSPKEIIRFENSTFRYIFFRRARLKSLIRAYGSWHEINEWMNENL